MVISKKKTNKKMIVFIATILLKKINLYIIILLNKYILYAAMAYFIIQEIKKIKLYLYDGDKYIYMNWSNSYAKSAYYTIGDLIMVDIKNINLKNVTLFMIISTMHKIMTIIQIAITIDYVVIHILSNTKISIDEKKIWRIIWIEIPKKTSMQIINKFKKKKISLAELKTIWKNATYILIFKVSKWNINNTVDFIWYLNIAIKKDPEWSTNKKETIKYILKISIIDKFIAILKDPQSK